MGIHLIVDLLGVDPERISRVKPVKEILERAVERSRLNKIASNFHQFEPHGVSAVYLLRESHLSVHTWPEYGYVALDIFACGDEESALRACEILLEEFKPEIVEKKILRRDLYERAKEPPAP
jgi:S-adenosylmethionine decarboxylase